MIEIFKAKRCLTSRQIDFVILNCYFDLQLDDAALQLYKDGDYGSYLDLEASISEQQEEFEEFQES